MRSGIGVDERNIRKKYGENMWHLCKKLFPTILNIPGKLSEILESRFYPSKFLYDDIINLKYAFKQYIHSLAGVAPQMVITTKTPFELLSEVGYTLYECRTLDDVMRFKHYYAPGEVICTYDPIKDRTQRRFVFFAVKNDVDRIERSLEPNRNDEYGTSVLSIQFDKGEFNDVHIINRYNKEDNGSDATFGDNLDNIIPGLTYSFGKFYGYNFNPDSTSFDIESCGYVCIDGVYYKFNNYIFLKDENDRGKHIYACVDNILIIDNKVIKDYALFPERYILASYFVIDLKEKTIKLCDDSIEDSFCDEFINITSIVVLNNQEEGTKLIKIVYDNGKEAFITLNSKNQIIKYENNCTKNILTDNWLVYCKHLKYIIMNELEEVANSFLDLENSSLVEATFKKLKKAGNCFMQSHNKLKRLIVPQLEELSDYALFNAQLLEYLEMDKIRQMGNSCFHRINSIIYLMFPDLERLGSDCFSEANSLEKLSIPKVVILPKGCFSYVKSLKELEASSLQEIKAFSFCDISSIRVIKLSELSIIESGVFAYVNNLVFLKHQNLYLKKVKKENIIIL